MNFEEGQMFFANNGVPYILLHVKEVEIVDPDDDGWEYTVRTVLSNQRSYVTTKWLTENCKQLASDQAIVDYIRTTLLEKYREVLKRHPYL